MKNNELLNINSYKTGNNQVATFIGEFNFTLVLFTIGIAIIAGFIKGSSGFAFPMIMLSGLGVLYAPEQAVAYLIFPLFVVNAIQLFQYGVAEAKKIAREYIRISLVMCVFLIIASPLVIILPKAPLYLILGIPITAIAILQLLGWRLRLPPHYKLRAEYITGVAAGVSGGFAGVWAPLIVLYLLSINVSKKEYILAQGMIYTVGSIALIGAHLNTTILNGYTIPTSMSLILPSITGLYLGIKFSNRLNKRSFRKLVLVVLALAGINLIIQGFI